VSGSSSSPPSCTAIERSFAVRKIAVQKLGYFPLPLKEAERIGRFLVFSGQATSVLDPCAGTGAALATITVGANVVRYAVESFEFRAQATKSRNSPGDEDYKSSSAGTRKSSARPLAWSLLMARLPARSFERGSSATRSPESLPFA
jgi:hypothetical protein